MIGMKGSDILRIVDALHREKGVDKEIIFMGIEAALLSAAKKKLGMEKNIVIEISRDTGEITALDDETPITDLSDLGRIGALTAKQVMIQKIREILKCLEHSLATAFVIHNLEHNKFKSENEKNNQNKNARHRPSLPFSAAFINKKEKNWAQKFVGQKNQ